MTQSCLPDCCVPKASRSVKSKSFRNRSISAISSAVHLKDMTDEQELYTKSPNKTISDLELPEIVISEDAVTRGDKYDQTKQDDDAVDSGISTATSTSDVVANPFAESDGSLSSIKEGEEISAINERRVATEPRSMLCFQFV